MRRFLTVVLAAVALAFVTGCRTMHKRLTQYESHAQKGEYGKASDLVKPLALRAGCDQLMWVLHEGSAQLWLQNYAESARMFDQAEELFAHEDVKSGVGENAAWLVYNDTAMAYNSLGQERVMCNVYKAVGCAARGDVENARVELNRALQRQENFMADQAKLIEKERGEMEKAKSKMGNTHPDALLADGRFAASLKAQFGVDVSQNFDAQAQAAYASPYLYHLAGVFRWLNGDGGRDYLRRAAEMQPDNALFAADFADVEARGEVPPGRSVWVYIEDGLCPRREERRVDIPVGIVTSKLLYTGGALSVLHLRDGAFPGYEVTSGAQAVKASLVADMDALLKREFAIWFKRALMREVTRVIIKTTAQAALLNQKSDGAQIGGLVMGAYQVATTRADIRSWTALPKRVYGARVAYPSDGKIVLATQNGWSYDVSLPASGGHAIVWVRVPAGPARPVVTVIPFS